MKSTWYKHGSVAEHNSHTTNSTQAPLSHTLFHAALTSNSNAWHIQWNQEGSLCSHTFIQLLEHTLATALRCVISASKIITCKPIFFVSLRGTGWQFVFWHRTRRGYYDSIQNLSRGKNPIPSGNVDSWFSYWLVGFGSKAAVKMDWFDPAHKIVAPVWFWHCVSWPFSTHTAPHKKEMVFVFYACL